MDETNRFREYRFSRLIIRAVERNLKARGVPVVVIDPKSEPSAKMLWSNRVVPANQIENAFYFSLHNNAATSNINTWALARGAEFWTSKGQTTSDRYATYMHEVLKGLLPFIYRWRIDMTDGDIDKEANFTELLSKHPSVLFEYLFMDNREDVNQLLNIDYNNLLIKGLSITLENIGKEIINF
jgi:N-acetylmuramoyl-L-alanine amidase